MGTPLDPCSRYLVDLRDYQNARWVVGVDFFTASGERWRRDLLGGTPERYSGQGIPGPGVWPPAGASGGLEDVKLIVKRVGKADLCDAA